MHDKVKSTPSLGLSFIPLIVLMGLLAINITYFGDSATYGPNQIALLLAAATAVVIGFKLGFGWEELLNGIVKSIQSSLSAVMILLMIGALAGTWMISGIVPSMIFYGLDVIHPKVFLFAACLVSAIVSLATGSSWSTVATVGLALLGIGTALGVHQGMIAGAVISGAYFGDKMSPLSDTTNLAPAMAGTDLFTHIRYMTLTTFPTLLLTFAIFLVIGFTTDTAVTGGSASAMQDALSAKFNINPWLFLVPALVIFMIIKKVDALPALFIGTVAGGIFACIFQPQIIKEIAGTMSSYAEQSYKAVIMSMSGKLSIETSNTAVSELLTTKGMEGMMNTIWLIITAMAFGGVLEITGILERITQLIIRKVKSAGSLIASTAATCLFFNVTASDQYLAIVVPGRMFAKTYADNNLAPENLSRTLEDSGTVTSVLIPWNTCGAAQSTVLGVATGEYWMYCFFNILSPIMTVIFGYFNIKIKRIKPEDTPA
jgi:Na+:H+ antiporter, NhaC family